MVNVYSLALAIPRPIGYVIYRSWQYISHALNTEDIDNYLRRFNAGLQVSNEICCIHFIYKLKLLRLISYSSCYFCLLKQFCHFFRLVNVYWASQLVTLSWSIAIISYAWSKMLKLKPFKDNNSLKLHCIATKCTI